MWQLIIPAERAGSLCAGIILNKLSGNSCMRSIKNLIKLRLKYDVFRTADFSYQLGNKIKRLNLNSSRMNVVHTAFIVT
jgi:hypothetical protein